MREPNLLPFVVYLVYSSLCKPNFLALFCSCTHTENELGGAEPECQNGAGSWLRTALSHLLGTLSFDHTFLFTTVRMVETKCTYNWFSTVTLFFEILPKNLVSGSSLLAQLFPCLNFLTHFYMCQMQSQAGFILVSRFLLHCRVVAVLHSYLFLFCHVLFTLSTPGPSSM